MISKIHPQTRALTIGNYGCLAMCYIYCLGIEPDEMGFIRIINDAIAAGVHESGIRSDCYVENAVLFAFWLTGKKWDVDKKICMNISGIKDPTPVNYTYRDSAGKMHNHFVVVENGEIVFNPLETSASVDKGKPESMRIIKLHKD